MTEVVDRVGFTPGPWECCYLGDSGHYGAFQIRPFAERQREYLRGKSKTVGTRDEREANAHLIASAPDLYDAAMEALGLLQPLTAQGEDAIWRPANKAWEALAAATRKARGEQ